MILETVCMNCSDITDLTINGLCEDCWNETCQYAFEDEWENA